MRRKNLIPLLFILAVVSTSASAQEIVYFKNGTSMPIRSYEIEDDMIRIVLDSRASLSFPVDQVERIEDAEGQLIQSPATQKNRIVSGPVDAKAEAQSGLRPSRHRRDRWEGNVREERVQTDEHGLVVQRPYASPSRPNMNRISVAGSRSIANRPPTRSSQNGIIGTTRVGNRYAMPPTANSPGRTPIGLTSGMGSAPADSTSEEKKE